MLLVELGGGREKRGKFKQDEGTNRQRKIFLTRL
jgi:hypothetical protein